MHEFIIKSFKEIFKINEEYWRARILIKNTNNGIEAKKYWREILRLKEEQFYPSISPSELNTDTNGNLRICLDFTIIPQIFKYVFRDMQNLNEKDSLEALNGILDAEGSVSIERGGLHKITISFNQKEKELFKKVLKNSDLISFIKEKEDRFIVEGWLNHYLFIKKFIDNSTFPFPNNRKRQEKLISGFLNHRFTQTANKYLRCISNKKEKATNLSNKLNIRDNSFLETIKKPRYERFINIDKHPYRINIKEEGLNFLKIVDEFKSRRQEKDGSTSI